MPWFRVIARRIPDHWGEPKSIPGVNVFFSLSERERRSVLHTLRRVRIHITDPRSYYDTYESALKPMLQPGVTAQSFLSRHDERPHIRRIQESLRRTIAQDIVDDSPAERFRQQNELLDCFSGRRIASWIPVPRELQGMIISRQMRREFDVSVFEKRSSNMVNQAATAVAKSASVFSDALEMVTEEIRDRPAISRAFAATSILRSVIARRAFDKGEPDSLKFIREQQNQLLAEVNFPGNRLRPEELIEVESTDHQEIQAGDIAAGIARAVWYRAGLVDLVRHFDHVLLNGMRLSETTASSHPYSRPPLR